MPPNPYGVYPNVLYESFSSKIPGLTYIDTLNTDNSQGSIIDSSSKNPQQSWENALIGNLEAGISTLCWYQMFQGDRGNYEGYPVAEYEHVGVAVGYSNKIIWMINPWNLDIIQEPRLGLADRALAVGGGLMCIRERFTQPS